MCLIIHKPSNVAIPADLLRAALSLNSDGWGLMGLDATHRLLIERHTDSDLDEVLATEERLRHAEYTLHLRQRTRGRVDLDNTHPFEIDDGHYLMHNGTLNFEGGFPGHSDTRSFAHFVLRPLARKYAGLIADRDFQALLALGLQRENKVVLFDFPRRRFDILNRQHGFEFEGLWLSSIKWIDSATLPLTVGPEVQQRSYGPQNLSFL